MPFKLVFLFGFVMLFFQLNAQDTSFVLPEKRATYYHNRFENRKTSSGERFSQKKYTAAHKYIALGSIVKVTNLKNKKTILVKVNDRCPKKGVIDLSYIAAQRLDIIKSGHAEVSVEVLPDYFYDLWRYQDSLFLLLDKYSYSDSLQKMYQDSLALVQKNKLENQLLWTYYLQIATARTFADVQKEVSNLPEKYRIYARAILIKGKESSTYYKVIIGPFMSEDAVQKIKKELNSIFEDLKIEENKSLYKI